MKRDPLSKENQKIMAYLHYGNKAGDPNGGIDAENSEAAQGQTVQLLGRGGLYSPMCYCGVDRANILNITGTGVLMFRPNCDDMVYMCVYVNWSDEYVVDLIRIEKAEEGAEGAKEHKGKLWRVNTLKSTECFIDNLGKVFESTYDGYCNEHQGGFISL
jgi:hypothetical protein